MSLTFWEYSRIGHAQWKGQTTPLERVVWYLLGSPDIHTHIRNTHACNLIERLNLPDPTSVLDTGCGRGGVLFYLAHKHPRWHLTGLELDDKLIRACQRAAGSQHWPNLTFVKASVSDVSEHETYNLAICTDVLEHVPDDIGLLRRIYAALRPGGYLIVHVPRYRLEQWRLFPAFKRHNVKGEFGHVRDEYQLEVLQERITQSGFMVREVHQTFGRLGEIAFEINNLFWEMPVVRKSLAILTYPLSLPIGYLDTLAYQKHGNSFLVLAQRAE